MSKPRPKSAAANRAYPALAATPQLVTPGEAVNLNGFDTDARAADVDKKEAKERHRANLDRLGELQEVLYAGAGAGGEGHGRGRSVLVLLQAMDAGGKDSTVRRVFGRLNPQGVRVTSFKKPTDIELAHDFLWRHHLACPESGMIALHNRSHYEAVLVERVAKIAPEPVWRGRFAHIRHFERMLFDEGTVIVKLYLHLSKGEQKERFQDRLDRPDKHWKFNPADLVSRRQWGAYRQAFQEALQETSTREAPWYAIPADQKWWRDLLIGELMIRVLENMELKYPPPPPEIEDYEVK